MVLLYWCCLNVTKSSCNRVGELTISMLSAVQDEARGSTTPRWSALGSGHLGFGCEGVWGVAGVLEHLP